MARVQTKINNPFSDSSIALGSYSLQGNLSPTQVYSISNTICSMEPWITLGYKVDYFSSYLSKNDPALIRYGIFKDGTPIGVLCIRYPWLRGPYIEVIGIEPSHQGKGIASRVIDWIRSEVSPVSGNIWLCVSSFNLRAINAYKALGFTSTALIEDLILEGKEEIIMRLRIQ